MQYIGLGILFWIIIGVVCLIGKACQSLSNGSRTRRRTRVTTSSPPSPQDSTTPVSPTRSANAASDPVSSPIGFSCLNCGAVFEEETEILCPACGVTRERCTICQRFVAGGQELLACPHCQTLGHANEMKEWVKQKYKCPLCATRLSLNCLIKPAIE